MIVSDKLTIDRLYRELGNLKNGLVVLKEQQQLKHFSSGHSSFSRLWINDYRAYSSFSIDFINDSEKMFESVFTEVNALSYIYQASSHACHSNSWKKSNISTTHNRLKNPIWRGADQMAIYKHDREFQLGSTEKQLQLCGPWAEMEPATSIRISSPRPNHSTTLPRHSHAGP